MKCLWFMRAKLTQNVLKEANSLLVFYAAVERLVQHVVIHRHK